MLDVDFCIFSYNAHRQFLCGPHALILELYDPWLY